MEEARGDFQDWELLHNTETGTHHRTNLDFDDIERVSEGIIRSDYFASEKQHVTIVHEKGDSSGEEGSVGSDNPSWVEPASVSRYLDDPGNELRRKNSSEFWSDSSADEPRSHKDDDFDGKQEVGFGDYAQREVGFDGIGELGGFDGGVEDIAKFWSDSSGEASIGGIGEEEKEMMKGDSGVGEDVLESAEVEGDRGEVAGETENVGRGAVSAEGEKKGMVWWKVPFEILKFYLFKVSPGWSIAMAAAVMGIVIFRSRLRKMKKKSRRVPLEITVEDKKVSQFMKNAARLNDAFLVVRRVPIIRPLLPTTGVTPWPVINLR